MNDSVFERLSRQLKGRKKRWIGRVNHHGGVESFARWCDRKAAQLLPACGVPETHDCRDLNELAIDPEILGQFTFTRIFKWVFYIRIIPSP